MYTTYTMSQHDATMRYLFETIPQIYKTGGLSAVIKHELKYLWFSTGRRFIRANNYLICLLDLAGDPISFIDTLILNQEIQQKGLENLLNPNLVKEEWALANWTDGLSLYYRIQEATERLKENSRALAQRQAFSFLGNETVH